MSIEKVIFKSDFSKLTKRDVDQIVEILDIELSEDEDPKNYLFLNKKIILKAPDAKRILLNKIFAGQTSVKWYKIYFKKDAQNKKDKKTVVRKIESDKCYYNIINDINIETLDAPTLYTSIKLEDNKYLMRFMVPSGTRTFNNGKDYTKIRTVNNVVVIIDLKNEYIEIRTNSKDAKRIIEILNNILPIDNTDGIIILKNYMGSLEKFKDSLLNGQFIQSLSMPDENLTISEENNELLTKMLIIIDEYFINTSIDRLTDSIKELNIDTDGTPFTQLLLAGMSKIGIKIRKDIKDDLSQQTLYKILKKYITTYSGLIRFCNDTESEMHTILVGLTTNSIFFKSSSDEKIISYIREKVL